MNTQQFKDRQNKTFQKALEKTRKCCAPSCENNAINSHILQKNGILSMIESDGHLRLSVTDFIKDDLFYFKREGINKAFTFKGFCEIHDNSIFKPIEDYLIDYECYKNQLLFAYRTILNELRRKEVLLDWDENQMQDEILKTVIDTGLMKASGEQYKQAIFDLNYYKEKLESDLNKDTENFIFKVRYTSSKEICLASHFTFETTRERDVEIKKNGKDFEILCEIFICFFPLDGENVLLMGYLKEFESKCSSFVNDFFDCDEDTLFKKISNLLMCRCEVWACSENFYSEKIKPRESQINKIFQESAISIDEDRDIELNIFN